MQMQQLCLFEYLRADKGNIQRVIDRYLPEELLGPKLVKVVTICPRCSRPGKKVEVEAEYKARLEARNKTIKKVCSPCQRTIDREVWI